MARPRIFVSSTYYDLKHLRSSLDNFIASLGFDSVLSEKGDIAYSPDAPLDESCYREVENVDVFVIIIGGRYGSEASNGEKKPSKEFFDRYDSITRKEYEAAASRNIPVYILIDASVYAEYQTFSRNKDNTEIRYAHVDSVNIFRLIADILAKPKNNPMQTFVRFGDIEAWLREQWAGLFRELLSRMSSQQQIESLSSQVDELREVSVTLRRYLEAMMPKVAPAEAPKLIAAEHERLAEAQTLEKLQENDWFQYTKSILRRRGRNVGAIRDAIASAKAGDEFCDMLGLPDSARVTLLANSAAQDDYNACRDVLGLPRIDFGAIHKTNESVQNMTVKKASKAPRKRGAAETKE